MRQKHDRSFVFKLVDIFKHLRGLKSVDKIKKYRRDIPRGLSLTTAAVSKKNLGNPSRYSLL